MVAEKLEPLVAVAALARGFQRGDVRERRGEQERVGEFVPDARFQRGRRGLGADLGAIFLSRRGFAPGVRLKTCFAR